MRALMSTLLVLAVGCSTERRSEAWQDWYDPGSALEVEEPLSFTIADYEFTGDTPIAEVPKPDDFETWFSPDDPPDGDCSGWRTSDTLPVEITGIVTLHPRWYIKVSGCRPEGDNDVDSDEKYFGSYFVEDSSGGYFVLGDSRVAQFDMGEQVTLRVRAVKEFFGMTMISAHDVLDVQRGPQPISYERVVDRLLGEGDLSKVVRVEGVVAAPMGGFGEIYLCTGDSPDTTIVDLDGDPTPACFVGRSEESPAYKVALDVELQRRGVDLPVGSRFAVTGPVQFSFSVHQVNVIRVGQLEPLED